MSILDELWYGNIAPYERDFKRGSTYSELLGHIVRHEEDLLKRLNDAEKRSSKNSPHAPTNCTASRSGKPFCEGLRSGQGSSSK